MHTPSINYLNKTNGILQKGAIRKKHHKNVLFLFSVV